MKWLWAALAVLLMTGAALGAGKAREAWHWSLPRAVPPPVLPGDNPMNVARVELGRRLFYDADLSIDGTMACATCHEQHRGFGDGNRTHAGVHGDPGRRNVPGLANVAWRQRLTWADPSLVTLEGQSAVPIMGETPVEMGMKGQEAALANRLGRQPCYARMFGRAFPATGGRIDMASIGMALAAFQRTMISFGSDYDRGRLSPAAQRGEALFRGEAGCAACHSGRDFTDDGYHGVGTARPGDRGLIEKTGRTEDEGAFRTPPLRNVAVTGPWLHDGSAATLEATIRAHSQVTPDGLPDLIAFLNSLTDKRFLTDPAFALPAKACGKRL